MLRFCLGLALALASLPAAAQVTGPAPCTGGSATLGGRTYECSGVDLLSMVTPQQMGARAVGQCASPYPKTCANDVWGWTDPETGREYALAGLENGTGFVDVTDPVHPVLLGRLPTQTSSSTWRDIKVYRTYALVVAESSNHGMQVFDLTRLRGLTANAARTFTPDAVYARVGSAHNLVVDEETGFAYAVGFRRQGAGLPASCNSPGMMAIDIRTPLAPVFAACFSDAAQDVSPVTAPGYTHDAQCLVYRGPDADYTGHEICTAANEDAVTVFDVSDKANVRVVSQVTYPNAAYTHQGWFTDDQRYFLVNDEEDEETGRVSRQRTMVFDLADLDAPDLAFQYVSALRSADHNLYVRGRYAYESNYESGLRILDLAQVGAGQVTEAAFFDTYPQATTVHLNGQWSNYPYFASGTIIANDSDNGLYMLRPTALAVGGDASPGVAAPGAAGLALSEPAPNPAGDATRISFTTDAPQRVRATLVDALGREAAVLFDGTAAGTTVLDVRRGTHPAGAYVVRVAGEHTSATRRLVFTR